VCVCVRWGPAYCLSNKNQTNYANKLDFIARSRFMCALACRGDLLNNPCNINRTQTLNGEWNEDPNINRKPPTYDMTFFWQQSITGRWRWRWR